MIRSELLQALAKESPDLRGEEIERVVEVFFDEIGRRLADGGRVELRGLARFQRARANRARAATRAPVKTSMCPESACLTSNPARKCACG